MKTIIHSTDFALTEALETFIRQQADKSLRVCSDQTERLIVRLKATEHRYSIIFKSWFEVKNDNPIFIENC